MHEHHHQSFSNGTTRIIANCRECDEPTIMTVNTPEYVDYLAGTLIQDAMPTLSANERELLISGFCGTCFNKLTSDVLPLSRLSTQTPTTHK